MPLVHKDVYYFCFRNILDDILDNADQTKRGQSKVLKNIQIWFVKNYIHYFFQNWTIYWLVELYMSNLLNLGNILRAGWKQNVTTSLLTSLLKLFIFHLNYKTRKFVHANSSWSGTDWHTADSRGTKMCCQLEGVCTRPSRSAILKELGFGSLFILLCFHISIRLNFHKNICLKTISFLFFIS